MVQIHAIDRDGLFADAFQKQFLGDLLLLAVAGAKSGAGFQ